ncbi:Mitochondrial aspartate-glutamate transporter AGC1 [Nakaseomyces bracarensis]|uniref:Mitochondrial aspartate-glutamate transporter AGC1 n=1 Tax=Nakaseomyces bracarensis TaxID=273131 RepID=A0ABR4NWC4_9SACH
MIMEQLNSNGKKKLEQAAIFKRFATTLDEAQDDKTANILSFLKSSSHKNETAEQVNVKLNAELTKGSHKSGEMVLKYDDFISLISSSQHFYSKFSGHSFSLNQVPVNTFGCIFFAMDENNKGYLTISDWFQLNNILENDNYHLIILYEFFRKFDVERNNAQLRKAVLEGKQLRNDSNPHVSDTVRRKKFPINSKSINYANKFLSFDELVLNLNQFKKTIQLLQSNVNDDFVKKNNLILSWDKFEFLKYYQCFHNEEAFLTLNSLVTILQNDLRYEKMIMGFRQLAQPDIGKHRLALNRNQLEYLLKLFYSHKISSDVFESLNLSNTKLIKSDNNSIAFNVYRDLFYLFQNFDLLNQVFIRFADENNMSERDIREQVITKKNLMEFMNKQYNKVNNIIEFSPSQINLLFSVVANSKEYNRHRTKLVQNSQEVNHEDREINSFIHNEFMHGGRNSKEELELFNDNYKDISNGFSQDSKIKSMSKTGTGWLETVFGGRNDIATMRSDLTVQDFLKILNPNYLNDVVHKLEVRHIEEESLYTNYYFYPIFDSLYNFSLGSIAGCIGATIVYPIDFVKTRMQAQRAFSQYKNSIDCFLKILSREGIRGIYSGLGPQLIGVAPEKAIKLTVNDYMRNKLKDNNGKLSPLSEIISGASAGACQVIFTNPLEIVKIRLQVRGEYIAENAENAQVTALQIIRKLGITGLYKGVGACLLRDVPFSAIYFPTYAHLKRDIFNFDPNDKTRRNRLNTWELLTAGALAGMPAAYLTTPFDVIKTRLQIDPKMGETAYKGIWHAAKTILKEESFRSFFKGGPARVLRSSPQFGFTLAAYELFHNIFPLPNDKEKFVIQEDDRRTRILNNNARSPDVSRNELHKMAENPYSDNYLNYYYKSCQVAKTFIELDNNFAKFDLSTYLMFRNYLKRISKGED